MTRRRLTTSPKALQAECDEFNAAFPAGSTIEVFPGDVRGLVDEVQVRDPGAAILGGHSSVVYVAGGRRAHGCIALTHVRGWPTRAKARA